MAWKTDKDGHLEVDDNGNPIFQLEGGEEKACDYLAMASSLAKANKESAERKDKLREQDAKLKLLEGIEDISAFIADAKKNADTVAAFDEKQKDVETATRARIDAAVAPLQKQIADLQAMKSDVEGKYHSALIDAQFGTSKYVNEELVNAAMAKELFAKHFSVAEDGSIEAKDANGSVIYDEAGKAGFEAALRKLVSQSPYKDIVLKGTNSSGSGAQSGGNSGGTRTGGPRSLAECKTKEEKIAYLNNEANLKLRG